MRGQEAHARTWNKVAPRPLARPTTVTSRSPPPPLLPPLPLPVPPPLEVVVAPLPPARPSAPPAPAALASAACAGEAAPTCWLLGGAAAPAAGAVLALISSRKPHPGARRHRGRDGAAPGAPVCMPPPSVPGAGSSSNTLELVSRLHRAGKTVKGK